MFLNKPIYKDVLRIVSLNNLILKKSRFKLQKEREEEKTSRKVSDYSSAVRLSR